MTIQFEIRGLKDDEDVRRQLRAGLEELNGLIAVTAAKIALQHQPGVTPSYQAVAVLVVPGPDIQAAARDHTWRAAWQKVVERLREQIVERQRQQTAQQRNRRTAAARPTVGRTEVDSQQQQ